MATDTTASIQADIEEVAKAVYQMRGRPPKTVVLNRSAHDAFKCELLPPPRPLSSTEILVGFVRENLRERYKDSDVVGYFSRVGYLKVVIDELVPCVIVY